MSKKRHSWIDVAKKTRYTKDQQFCSECGLIRFMALNSWLYSEFAVTDEEPFQETFQNEGCGTTLKNKKKIRWQNQNQG